MEEISTRAEFLFYLFPIPGTRLKYKKDFSDAESVPH